MTTQILIHLPTEVALRFRHAVPARKRSAFVLDLLVKNLPDMDEQMYQLGLQAEKFDRLHPEERKQWDGTLMDGLNPEETFDIAKLNALCQK